MPLHSIGVPLEFIEHSKRGEILEDLGITTQNITREIVAWSSSIKESKEFKDGVSPMTGALVTEERQRQEDGSAGR